MNTETVPHTSVAPKRTSGFTLVELMVVIAILALLATLIFSGYGFARDQGLAAAAISHSRTISLAQQLFMSDFDGAINGVGNSSHPQAGTAVNEQWRLVPYMIDVPWRDLDWDRHVLPTWRALWDRAIPLELFDDPDGDRYAIAYNSEFTLEASGSPPELHADTRFRRIFNYQRPRTTIHHVTGHQEFTVGHMDAPSQLPMPESGMRQGIYFPHKERTVATFLDGRVELLRFPIPRYLGDPSLPVPPPS